MEGIVNFRDLGGARTGDGRRVRRGRLFRSGQLGRITANDREAFVSLGIRTVIDLRTEAENNERPDRLNPDLGIRTIHLPILEIGNDGGSRLRQLWSLRFGPGRALDFAELMRRGYGEYVVEYRAEFADVIRLVGDPGNLPALVHCTAGKDRTGLACSLVLAALGVPSAEILREYLLTNCQLQEFKISMLKRLWLPVLFGIPRERFLPLFDARPEYLQAAFDRIGKDYGSVDGYLRHALRLTAADLQSLSEVLLEEDTPI